MGLTALRLAGVYAVLLAAGCSKPPVINAVSVSEAERTELLAAFDSLDEALQQHTPVVFEELAAPASAQDIATLQGALDGATRPYLAMWFGWHNGGRTGPVRLLPLGDMLSINEALADRTINQNIPLAHRRRRRDIKLLDDGAGDGYFLDLVARPPRVYYEMLEDPGTVDYGTLVEFVRFIEKVHGSGVTRVNEQGQVEFDLDAYASLEAEHLVSIGQ